MYVEPVLQLLNTILPLGYLLATIAYLAVFTGEPRWADRWATPVALSVAGIHLVYLALCALVYEHVPVANSWEGFTFMAFAIAVVYLVLEWRLRDKATGVFLFTPVLFFQTLSSAFVTHTKDVDPVLQSPLFGIHVTAALLGYAALAVAAVYGIMYLLLFRELKKHRVSLLFRRLPTLETLARLNTGAIVFGWLGLTLGIVWGSIWARELMGQGLLEGDLFTDPKFILTVALWGAYTVALGGRYLFRWPNRQLAVWSILAFALLLSSSLAVNLILPSFHRFI